MVHVHLLNGLEVDPSARLVLRLVGEVEQRAALPVEHEPPLLPRVELAAHFLQTHPSLE